jgi:hypothetical protein
LKRSETRHLSANRSWDSLCSIPAYSLRRDDRPAQIAKFDRHRLGSSLLAALLAKPAG